MSVSENFGIALRIGDVWHPAVNNELLIEFDPLTSTMDGKTTDPKHFVLMLLPSPTHVR